MHSCCAFCRRRWFLL